MIRKEEIKPSLLTDYMNSYIGKPKKSTKNLLKLIVKFSRVVGYKINNI